MAEGTALTAGSHFLLHVALSPHRDLFVLRPSLGLLAAQLLVCWQLVRGRPFLYFVSLLAFLPFLSLYPHPIPTPFLPSKTKRIMSSLLF